MLIEIIVKYRGGVGLIFFMSSIFNPGEILDKIKVEPEMVTADFGCGSGYFVIELAKRVGERGRVFAIDVVPQALESVRSLAKMRGFFNIETRWANLEKTSTLEENSCDLIIVSNLFFQVDKKYWDAIIEEIYKVLKVEGRVLVIDWDSKSVLGPPKENRVGSDFIKDLFSEKFKAGKKMEISDTHWALIFTKK